jgi:hypothetical protein
MTINDWRDQRRSRWFGRRLDLFSSSEATAAGSTIEIKTNEEVYGSAAVENFSQARLV